MLKRGTTRSFRERKIVKPIIPLQRNTNKNCPPLQPDRVQCSFDNQKNKPVSDKPVFIIRSNLLSSLERNTSLINPDVKNKENNHVQEKQQEQTIRKNMKKEQEIEEKQEQTVFKRVNGWITDQTKFFNAEAKKTLNVTGKSERAYSMRPKNKSKKKIQGCKIRKVIWGNNIPFDVGLSRIVQDQSLQAPIQSLKDLCELIQK